MTINMDFGTDSLGVSIFLNDKLVNGSVNILSTSKSTSNQHRRKTRGQRRKRKRIQSDLKQIKNIYKGITNTLLEPIVDIYKTRYLAIDSEISLNDLFNCFVHFRKNRGYKGNTSEEDDSEILSQIANIDKFIIQNNITIGQYFYQLQLDGQFIKNLYISRKSILDEFNTIYDKQMSYHLELTEQLKIQLYNCIFFQRKTYWDKNTIGKCSLEIKEPRCSKADLLFQKYRLYNYLNNVKINNIPLNKEQKNKIFEYLEYKKSCTINSIMKKLKIEGFCNYSLEDKVPGIDTNFEFLKEDSKWKSYSNSIKDNIVRSLINYLEDSKSKNSHKFELVKLDNGRSNLSRKAIQKMLPYIMNGESEGSAKIKCGYFKQIYKYNILDIGKFLNDKGITNPIVRRAISNFSHLLKDVKNQYNIDFKEQINIEVTKEFKSKKTKERYTKTNNKNKKIKEEISKKLSSYGIHSSNKNIEKYRLWEEQKTIDPYDLTKISLEQLFSSDYNIDHVQPQSLSGDNSSINKVVTKQALNDKKGQNNPFQWFCNNKQWEQIKQNAKACFSELKYNNFTKEISDDGFMHSQLSDTGYICSLVYEYLTKCGFTNIKMIRAYEVSKIRNKLGFNNEKIRQYLGLHEDSKDRSDCREHILDSIALHYTDIYWENYSKGKFRKDKFLKPYKNFIVDVKSILQNTIPFYNVHYKKVGELHDETIYGKNHTIRKDIKKITSKQIKTIKDDNLREVILKWNDDKMTDFPIMQNGFNVIKAKIEIKNSSIRMINDRNMLVNNNYRVLIYKHNGKICLKSIKLLDVQNTKIRDHIPKDAELSMSLTTGECVSLIEDGKLKCYTYRTTQGSSLTLRDIYKTNEEDKNCKFTKSINHLITKYDMKKVVVNRLGVQQIRGNKCKT